MGNKIPGGLVLFSVIFLLTACTSNEIGSSKDVNPDAIYFDYQVRGDEDGGLMAVKLQYRFGGRNGTTLLMEPPSKVEFDGAAIKADSSRMQGAYYEVIKPANDFTGKHTIVFTDLNGKQYKEEFIFKQFGFLTKLPAVVERSDLIFELDGLEPEDYLRIMVNDTARFSGIDRLDTVKNGRVVITRDDLASLTNGPVRLEILKEDEKRIKNGTPQGGRFSMSYGIRRDFELRGEKK